jgi:uncharacterized repeat protein (TIGR03803 family)
VNGTLYGTTQFGGAYDCHEITCGAGTVFSITTDGTEKVLHSFGEGTDGNDPAAGLTDVSARLYGTTTSGGMYGAEICGGRTVFSVATSGKGKVLQIDLDPGDSEVFYAGDF